MITKETARDIALAYREVETAETLLAEIKEAKARRGAPDMRDAFGARQDGLQLGIPSGENSRRLFNVPWGICIPVLEAHIAHHRAIISALSVKAQEEAKA